MVQRRGALQTICSKLVFLTIPVVLAWVSSSAPAEAADYCYRHIYSKSNCHFTYTICNTHMDCRRYDIPPNSTVRVAVPDDIYLSQLDFKPGTRCFRKDVNKKGNNINRGKLMSVMIRWQRESLTRTWCRITGLDGKSLDKYNPKSHWLTMNEPADGDIQITLQY